MADTTLAQSIKDAFDKTPPPGSQEGGDPKEEKKEISTEKKDEVSDEDKAKELADFENAKVLYAALKDPEKQSGIIEWLIKETGYQLPDGSGTAKEKKEEISQAKKDLASMLKEATGEDVAFLTEKWGPIIEKFIKEQAEESTKDLREASAQQKQERVQKEYTSAFDSVAKEFFEDGKVPEKMIAEMTRISKTMNFDAEKSDPREIVRDLLHAAAGRLGMIVQKIDIKKQAAKNKTSPFSQLNGLQPDAPDGMTEHTKLSIAGAIAAAKKKITGE